MPLRPDIRSVLVIGSGPIVIGQACEFDYSGTQACRVLRGEGIRVILVNSNPATIMTDPDMADATYVEPITAEVLTAIIAAERSDALLPTLGGQTTQYVDFKGNASMDIAYNPNHSAMAIEGITSPDGRIFGKMAHSERAGENIFKNVPGNKYSSNLSYRRGFLLI